jgi:hypothetical protein
MSSGNRGASRWPGALAGLEAGILGALVLLAYLMFDSAWRRQSVWSIPNLLATTFYGSAIRSGFGSQTWSGLALLIVMYGMIGALFSLLTSDHLTRSRITLLGLLLGITWFYFSFGVLWTRINPWVPLESPARAMWVGHVLYGAVMGWWLGRPRGVAPRAL